MGQRWIDQLTDFPAAKGHWIYNIFVIHMSLMFDLVHFLEANLVSIVGVKSCFIYSISSWKS